VDEKTEAGFGPPRGGRGEGRSGRGGGGHGCSA
jgi:hypothetical protein